ncbi:dTDP-4-dehydrorhamnose reductase [Actinocatenispora thailandica]|uniref:dTDP-4-dehydrorhamnose reductase n=2 Tax=Actinocatenispora thailandica TaxID=227318 RepID=A0A7R7DP08_9ACTN|nr:dTDP-4-dehydrorhamnose reductase [Actinocatenispora thailandica]
MIVTGVSGYLGGRLAARAVRRGWSVVGTVHAGRCSVAAVQVERIDLVDRSATAALLDRIRPDAVIHAATGRDRGDWAAVADATGTVAVAAAAVGARLVHVSSDAVLSGRQPPYDESALPDPVNRYGAGKAAAETVVKAVAPGAAIVRAPLIVGTDGDSKYERMTPALIAGEPGALFTDSYRSPIHVDDLSEALLELATAGAAAGEHAGVLNVAGPETISFHQLGMLIARRQGLDPALVPSARAGELDVVIPRDTRLDTSLATGLLTIRLRGVREFLA